MPTKYAVMVEPISPDPWTQSVEDSLGDAEKMQKFIEDNIRNLRVHIVPCEEEEKNGPR